ncbi:ABC-three component system protein [Paenibacillus sp. 2003]|uniref:ABC-three component system protein n=1 Tax=Paenibacillus TaxID=44249 RepID=UPI00286A9E1C|nr:ABC-three component system protein [Paenibacillus sp. 2003]
MVLVNRSQHFDYIEDKLSHLATRISVRGRLNILDLHLHSEDFYMHFVNLLFGWKLKNLNVSEQNVEGIDLLDEDNKIVVQVSATCTPAKVRNSLNKEYLKNHSSYRFKFISISKDASNLRKQTFDNPYGLEFSPTKDILDIVSILKYFSSIDIDEQAHVYEFIKKELGQEPSIIKLDSNLATIINVLSKEDLNSTDISVKKSFDVESKIQFNELNTAGMIIHDYVIHHVKLDTKYKQYDLEGKNKSLSVLQFIRGRYMRLCNEGKYSSDQIFFGVIDEIHKYLKSNNECNDIPYEELDVCINILVVDAFVRCKIFKNPEGYFYVTS